MQNRENVLRAYIKEILGNLSYTLTPLTGDASFRRYFRLQYLDNQQQPVNRIIMDAPPERETVLPFVAIAKRLIQAGLHAPTIHAAHEQAGFLLLDDFGDTLLLQTLTENTASHWYQSALKTLITMQQCASDNLPVFNTQHMRQETDLFNTWFLESYIGLVLNTQEIHTLDTVITHLITSIDKQPKVFIHRDYHSRNLMVLPNTSELGILDFQDAMLGPATYDLVSILKDCYITWSRERVLDWAYTFHASCPALAGYPSSVFLKDFDYCGLQRHLKVLGIFCRLYIRDNKIGYLQDLPRVLDYVLECSALYPDLHPLHDFLTKRVSLP